MLYWQSQLEAKYSQNPLLVKNEYLAIQAKIDKLTPSGKALLKEIYKYCDRRQNVDFDRQAVGFMLNRNLYRLATWDRRLLERLVGLKLVSVRWQAIAPYPDRRGRLVGRGRKMVYSLNIDVFWVIRMMYKQSRKKPQGNLQA